MSNEEGINIRFQGKPAGLVFEFTRSVGLEPGRGTIFVERSDLGALTVEEAGPDAPPGVPLRTTDAQRPGFVEVVDGKEYAVSWRDVLIADRSVEIATTSDDEGSTDLAKIELTDIRYLWNTRGCLAMWVNVPRMSAASSPLNVNATGFSDQQQGLARQAQIHDLQSQIDAGTLQLYSFQNVLTDAQNKLDALTAQGANDPALSRTTAFQDALATADQARRDIAASQTTLSTLSAQRDALQSKDVAAGFVPDPAQKRLADEAAAFIGRDAQIKGLSVQIDALESAITLDTATRTASGKGEPKIGPERKALNALRSQLSALKTQKTVLESQQKLSQAFTEAVANAALLNKTGGQPGRGGIVDAGGELVPSSMDEAGNAWTVRNLIEKRILPALPGALKIDYFPADVADRIVSAKVWDSVLPKKALAAVLDEFKLILALNFDSTVSFYKSNEGELVEANGQKIAYRPVGANGQPDQNVDDRVSWAHDTVTFAHVPPAVQVIGAPIIETARIALEPCGQIGGDSGAIVPLDEALSAIGLTREQAARLALGTATDRSNLGLTPEGMTEFSRWAFKWYRLPGGAENNSARLPILDSTGVLSSAGELLPLRVFSESFWQIDLLQARLVSFQVGAAVALRRAGSATAADFTTDSLASLGPLKSGRYTQCRNISFRESSSGFKVDHARGIVEFGSVQGLVAVEGLTLEESTLVSDRDPRVELEFAYVRKPSLTDPLSFAQVYSAFFVRLPDGTALRVPTLPPGMAPLPIYRPDFQVINDIVRGKTNRPVLDAVSTKLAQDQFSVPPSVPGAIVQFCRPVMVKNNGRVLSVTWRVENEAIATTTAHAGSFAPLAPVPALATRGFGGDQGERLLLKDHVLLPKGLTR